MKYFLFILFMCTVVLSFGQNSTTTTEEMVSVPKSMLTEQQKSAINTVNKIETVSKWAGLGKEVGEAVNESLQALTNTAVDFSKTDLGIFTMVLVAWKVVGRDLLKIFIGVPFFFIMLIMAIWYHKTVVLDHRVRTKGNLFQWFLGRAEYEIKEGDPGQSWVLPLWLAIVTGISALIIFS